MVLRLGNDIVIPGGLHIQQIQGRNKTHHSLLVMDIWGDSVPVISQINYKFVFTCLCYNSIISNAILISLIISYEIVLITL